MTNDCKISFIKLLIRWIYVDRTTSNGVKKTIDKTKIQNTSIDREGKNVLSNLSENKKHAAGAYRHRRVVCHQLLCRNLNSLWITDVLHE